MYLLHTHQYKSNRGPEIKTRVDGRFIGVKEEQDLRKWWMQRKQHLLLLKHTYSHTNPQLTHCCSLHKCKSAVPLRKCFNQCGCNLVLCRITCSLDKHIFPDMYSTQPNSIWWRDSTHLNIYQPAFLILLHPDNCSCNIPHLPSS